MKTNIFLPLIIIGLVSCSSSIPSSIEEPSSFVSSEDITTSSEDIITSSEEETTSIEVKKYTVTWLNYNDDVLEVDEDVLEGEMPQYDGLDPYRIDDLFHYTWKGWTPTLEEVHSDQTYKAIFDEDYYFEYDIEHLYKYGMKPLLSQDDKHLTYGLYPQTVINDSSLIVELNKLDKPKANGACFYNDDFYVPLEAKPYKKNYKFNSGETVNEGSKYWFKCEPIVWDILDANYSDYYLLSSKILDIHCYYRDQEVRDIGGYAVYPNDYEDSDIRHWLNNDFYLKAFMLHDNNIMTTLVDNSASSTNSIYNYYWCNDTLDKVFLPSYQDYINENYGFSNSKNNSQTRCVKVTDYAIAKGSYYCEMSGYKGNGSYWTRSPDTYSNSSYSSWVINYMGGIGFDGVDYEKDGIRAAIHLDF